MSTPAHLTHVPTTKRGRDLLRSFAHASGMTLAKANETLAAYAVQNSRVVMDFRLDEYGGAAAPAADHADHSAAQS